MRERARAATCFLALSTSPGVLQPRPGGKVWKLTLSVVGVLYSLATLIFRGALDDFVRKLVGNGR